mmetsp:Transcript_157126/g.289592  ORF Transcript_157126/g.289592 Transcript_157126/m.289592 type:complete len:91 (-) Transcript_157126:136-408(-)
MNPQSPSQVELARSWMLQWNSRLEGRQLLLPPLPQTHPDHLANCSSHSQGFLSRRLKHSAVARQVGKSRSLEAALGDRHLGSTDSAAMGG